MNIALDISPLKSGHYLQHRVRGTGFYIHNLRKSFEKYFPDNKYVFFNRGDLLPNDIDVVHYPYFEPFFLTLPLFSKNKRVVTVHDLTPLNFPQHFKVGIRGMFKWRIQKLALKNVSAIITDSESSKKDIVKYVGIEDSKINVIYLAAGEEFRKINNSELIINNLRRKYNLPDKFALYVGDVTWNKNLPKLIKAVQMIGVPLVLVGKAFVDLNANLNNSWNKDLVTARRMIDGDKHIILLGFVPTNDLVVLYNMATVFAMPSAYEGFGLPILEAMSCGCPVVTSKQGSIPEIAEEACRYIDFDSAESIAMGIKEVFNSISLQKKFSVMGINQSKKFTWSKTAKETIGVYKDVGLAAKLRE